jgi:hypothetical protein
MNDDLEKKLETLTKIVEEDHKMIKGIYIRSRLASFVRILYWAVIILAAFGSYYFISPYLQSLREAYDSIIEVKGSLDPSKISDFFKKSE